MTASPWDVLPHSPPFVFVDRIDELQPGAYARGRKLVTADEAPVVGYLPGRPVLPGVFLLEALAQLGGIAWLSEQPGTGAAIASVKEARFGETVVPGDVVELEVRVVKAMGPIARMTGGATVAGAQVMQAEFTMARDGSGQP